MGFTHRETLAQAQRRRFLARRRCLRALRRTLTYIVLVTPFFYFGYILYSHMPLASRRSLPVCIWLYGNWMFLRNMYTFFRYIRSAPAFAPLPIIVNIIFILYYPPGPFQDINMQSYFTQFKQDRMEVVRLIEEGKLEGSRDSQGYAKLPELYGHVGFANYSVHYVKNNKGTSVFFSTNWTREFADDGFLYCPDDNPANWDPEQIILTKEKIERFWYHVVLDFSCIDRK